MKKMMKTTMIMFLFLGITNISMAQEKKAPKTPEEKSEAATKHLTEQLNLSEAQQVKVKEITLKKARDTKAIKDEMKVLKAKMKAVNKKSEADINAILTDEQKVKWQAMKEKKKAKQKEKSGSK